MEKPNFELKIPNLSPAQVTELVRRRESIWRDFQASPPGFTSLLTKDYIELKKFARAQRGKWESVLVLGIGGSSLGGEALVAALGRAKPVVRFLANVDPTEFARISKQFNLKKTLIIVISKSGGTLETIANFLALKTKLNKAWQKQVVVITDPEQGYLRRLALREQLTTFTIPPDVGGRYSVLSPVGLLPAALAGIPLDELLAGAREVDGPDAFLFALTHAELYRRGHAVTVFCPYAQSLRQLGQWYAQLLAESVGKSPTVGITPVVALGATDQHSELQLWTDGPADKFFIFLGVAKFATDVKIQTAPSAFAQLKGKSLAQILHAELAGTVSALVERQRPVAVFDLPELSARTLGYLLYFFELEVAFLGHALGVNPYDQPGVERGKELTRKLLGK